jgi:hypothetical protein
MTEVSPDSAIWIRARAQTDTSSPTYLLVAGGSTTASQALHGVYSKATATINNREFYRQVRGPTQLYWSAVGDHGQWTFGRFPDSAVSQPVLGTGEMQPWCLDQTEWTVPNNDAEVDSLVVFILRVTTTDMAAYISEVDAKAPSTIRLFPPFVPAFDQIVASAPAARPSAPPATPSSTSAATPDIMEQARAEGWAIGRAGLQAITFTTHRVVALLRTPFPPSPGQAGKLVCITEMMSTGHFIGRKVSMRTGRLHEVLLEHIQAGHLLPVEPAVAVAIRKKIGKHVPIEEILVLLPCGEHFRA